MNKSDNLPGNTRSTTARGAASAAARGMIVYLRLRFPHPLSHSTTQHTMKRTLVNLQRATLPIQVVLVPLCRANTTRHCDRRTKAIASTARTILLDTIAAVSRVWTRKSKHIIKPEFSSWCDLTPLPAKQRPRVHYL